MKVRAKNCFSGIITMVIGEVKEIEDEYILNDLLKAGYVEPAEVMEESEEGETELLTGYLDKAQLEEMHAADLKKLAKQLGLSDSGKKAELIERITAKEVSVEKEESESATEGGDAV